MLILDAFVVMICVQAVFDVSPSPSAPANAEAYENTEKQDGSDGNQNNHKDIYQAVAEVFVVDVYLITGSTRALTIT